MKLPQIKLRNGFTLVEILVAISIMAIVTSIFLIGFSQVRKSTRDSQRMHDLGTIQQALEMYRSNYNTYPPALDDSQFSKYLNPLPADPAGSSGRQYSYTYLSSDEYVLCAEGETDKYTPPSQCATPCPECTMGITSP